MNIAVTGGIGTGKSFVAKALAAELGCRYISADAICRILLEPGGSGYNKVRREFSDDFFLPDGSIDRSALRSGIFSDRGLRKRLDSLLHPLVRSEILQECHSAKESGEHLVVEIPLLFESGWKDDFDTDLVVFADTDTCVSRIVVRDTVSADDALKAISAQMSLEEKCHLGDRVIDNSGTFKETMRLLQALAAELS